MGLTSADFRHAAALETGALRGWQAAAAERGRAAQLTSGKRTQDCTAALK